MGYSLLAIALLACGGSRSVVPASAPVASDERVRVITPAANSAVRSPLTVRGEARGPWYFEASFPVRLLDASGQLLAQAPAQAEGEWMTESFVPFSVTLTFQVSRPGAGTLVLERSNASGLPEHAAEVRVPVQLQRAVE